MMSANTTCRKHHPPGISPNVTTDPLRKRIESPTAVHEFADETSDVTETSSDCSSLGQYMTIAHHDHEKTREEEEAAYEDYLTRMSRLVENAHVSETVSNEIDAHIHDVPNADATGTGIQLESRYHEDASKCSQITSKCCGMTDEVHETLFHSAKWLCHRLSARPIGHTRKLDESSAAIIIQSKWRSFIASKHFATTISSVLVFFKLCPSREVDEADLSSCAIIIQSRWRTYLASRRYAQVIAAVGFIQSFLRREFAINSLRLIRDKMDQLECIGDIIVQSNQERAAILCQSIVRRMLVTKKIQNAHELNLQAHDIVSVESAVIKCQCAVRRWIASRHLEQLRDATCRYPNQKHVARTGQIELILNGTSETAEETLTAYSVSSDATLEEDLEVEDESSCCPSGADNSEAQFEPSRCGLSDDVHEMLIQSGKWIYDRVGDPSVDTANDLLTIMEISEEVVFCCGVRPCK